jgi:hypothetical protein
VVHLRYVFRQFILHNVVECFLLGIGGWLPLAVYPPTVLGNGLLVKFKVRFVQLTIVGEVNGIHLSAALRPVELGHEGSKAAEEAPHAVLDVGTRALDTGLV